MPNELSHLSFQRDSLIFPASVVLLLAWGALAFGAEYSWAYAPLLVFSVVVGVLGLLASRTVPFPSRALALALITVFLGGLVQLVPLPARARVAVSPAAFSVDYHGLYAAATMRPDRPSSGQIVPSSRQPEPKDVQDRRGEIRALSIEPSRTMLGLAFLAALTILLVGSARGLSAAGPFAIGRGIVALGIIVALIGIVQRAVASEAVYGFWYPPKGGVPFAPFINENHFAGWMVMAMSLATGWFAGSVASGLQDTKWGWRRRILWLSSPDASEAVLTGFAIAVMALSMVLTISRGGLICLVAAILISSWWVLRRQSSRPRRFIAAGYLAFVLVVAASWGGVEAVIRQFEGATPDIGGRLGIWQEALRIIRDFPLTGTGLNTYGIAMLHYQTLPRDQLFIEAHNDYLQLAAEGGLLLGVPALAAIVLFVREVCRRFQERGDDARTYWLRVGAVLGLGSVAIQEFVDFTLQMPGAAALFVILAAIAIHRPLHASHHPDERRQVRGAR